MFSLPRSDSDEMYRDFGSNGLRLGCLISQSNPPLHKAMESSILLIKVSSPADVLWSSLLLDPIQLTIYINLNRQLLSDAYRRAVRWLEGQAGQGIKWRKSNAGHFIWIDLRGFLAPEGGVKAEEELAERFWNSGVNVVSLSLLPPLFDSFPLFSKFPFTG